MIKEIGPGSDPDVLYGNCEWCDCVSQLVEIEGGTEICTTCNKTSLEVQNMKFRVKYKDKQQWIGYDDEQDAIIDILEAHSEGVGIDAIKDEHNNIYSCIWNVILHKES